MESEQKTNKFKRVKKHIKEHKAVYITGIASFTAGAIVATVWWLNKNKKIEVNLHGVIDGDDNTITAIVNSTIYQQTISPYGNKLGRPGTPVYDMTDKKLYRSATLAAKSIDVSNTLMSKHLNNGKGDLKGHIFIKMEILDPYSDLDLDW